MNALWLVIALLPSFISAKIGNITTINVCCPTKSLTYGEEWDYYVVRPNANLFYWLYYEVDQSWDSDRPWFVWLQGGPGASSTGFGNFDELGPLDVNLNPRNTTWLSRGDVVFIDNPVGTGYSYVTNDDAYTTNVDEIASDLTNFTIHFISTHPQYKDRPLFILCESYGGKMAAAYAWRLHTAIQSGRVEINLKGVGLGDSWISPIDFVDTWPDYLYYFSRLSPQGLSKAKAQADRCDGDVQNGRWSQATSCWQAMEGLVGELSGDVSWYNVLKQNGQDPWSLKSFRRKKFSRNVNQANDDLDSLMNGPIREKLGIIPNDVTWGGQSGEVFNKQYGDFMKPVIDTVDSLLNYTQLTVFIYNGVEKWVNKLKWPGLPTFQNAKRKAIHNKYGHKELAAFSQQYKNFQFYWVLNAGHMVAADTPTAMLTILDLAISS